MLELGSPKKAKITYALLELGSPKKAKITYALPDFGDEFLADTQTHKHTNTRTRESLLVYRYGDVQRATRQVSVPSNLLVEDSGPPTVTKSGPAIVAGPPL